MNQILSAQESLKNRFSIGKDSDVEIEAWNVEIRRKENLYIATGDVVFKSEGFILSAQKAVVNRNTETAELSGGILIE